MRNWDNEKRNLSAGDDEWFKPAQGQNKVKFLDEGGEDYEQTYDNRTVNKVNFAIEVDEKQYIWGVTKAKKDISLWGQIVAFALNNGGLKGKTITLLVQGEKKDTRYTIMENMAATAEKVESK